MSFDSYVCLKALVMFSKLVVKRKDFLRKQCVTANYCPKHEHDLQQNNANANFWHSWLPLGNYASNTNNPETLLIVRSGM